MLIDATLESSITPPFRVTDSDLGIGAAPETGGVRGGGTPSLFPSLKGIILGAIRPNLTLKSDLPFVGARTWSPYGRPFPWQIGLTLMLLGIGFIGFMLFKLFRRIV